ncbi:uroporphyrinogen-III synthase [Sphingomonas abietis]|uniref:Uroporphyrinogen-III synthase n=1 Tax=Sphingomonas abietis TaxID=3012344 RepID=A0ABY7NLT8_9SPHN|nr:uroporphyrinogen-III synthase [Sphingomonas abietis]WBO22496.1 uroporphyrinogen-III synthase [Sphingomonas abietis]
MNRPLLVLRPEPGASATVAAARAIGLAAIAAPLFTIRPLDWVPPTGRPQAILATSANALRHGGIGIAALIDLPLYAVGAATAEVARYAGFGRIIVGDGDADAILALASSHGVASLLHLAGREHRATARPGIAIERRIVYAADPLDALPEAARAALPGAIALLHSPRAAALFARLVDPAGIAIAAISAATLEAAGTGWRAHATAERPTDASLLAVAAKLCDQGL